MPDPAERFIAAAVRPLEDDAEMQMVAGQELREMIEENAVLEDPASLLTAAERLEKRGHGRWRWILYGLTALVSVLAMIPVVRDYMRYRAATYCVFSVDDPLSLDLPGPPITPGLRSEYRLIFGKLSSADSLLLFGDLSSSLHDKYKRLWELEPENPALFSEYASGFSRWESKLPPDYLTTSDRLDPTNSWFRFFVAGVAARDATILNYSNHSRGTGKRLPFVASNQARLNEALSLLEEAAELPHYENFCKEVFLRRLSVLPLGEDVLERKFSKSYLVDSPESLWIYGELSKAVSVKAAELASARDVPGFLKLATSWETFCRRSIENADGSFVEISSIGAAMGFASEYMAAAAKDLGLADQEFHFSRLDRAFKDRRASRKTRDLIQPAWRDRGARAWWFANLSKLVASPPPLTEADLKPSRMAELSMLDRVLSIGAWLLFLTTASLVALARFGQGRHARKLSLSLFEVLEPRDHFRILLIGVLFPFLTHCLVVQFTPLGGGEWGLPKIMFSKAVQTLALGGMMLSLPPFIVAKQIGHRLDFLGWKRHAIPEAILFGVTFLLWLAAGFANSRGIEINWGSSKSTIWFFTAFIVGTTLVPFCGIFSTRSRVIRTLTCSRGWVLAYVFAILLMALSIPFHHALEKHWTRLDQLTTFQRGIPAMNRYDHEIAVLMKAEILEILNTSR